MSTINENLSKERKKNLCVKSPLFMNMENLNVK